MFEIRFKQDTFIRKMRSIIRRNTLSAGVQHLNWKFNVFVHRKTTFMLLLLLLWRVIWAARYFWWSLLIGPIKNWDQLPILFHSVPIISGPTFNGIGKNRCPGQLIGIGMTRCWYLDAFPKQFICFIRLVTRCLENSDLTPRKRRFPPPAPFYK